MGRVQITRGMAFRALARLAVVLLVAASLALALAGPGLAATDAPTSTSSGNTTILIAGVIGAAIAGVWLLKPSRQRRGRRRDVVSDSSAQPPDDSPPPAE
jgi:membrane protein implicated in regulation of membrane protease activity